MRIPGYETSCASDSACESVVGGVGPDFCFEGGDGGGVVDDEELGAGDAGVVGEGFGADGGGHDGVVGGAGGEPGGGGGGEVGGGLPDGAADREAGQRLGGLRELHGVGDLA